jgi:hypothetical protein
MHKTLSDPLAVYHPEDPLGREVGAIVLNGYHIDSAQLVAERGNLRSFRIVRGSFMEEWAQQTALELRNPQGQAVTIKIVAYPTEKESFGLVQFL